MRHAVEIPEDARCEADRDTGEKPGGRHKAEKDEDEKLWDGTKQQRTWVKGFGGYRA